MTALRREATKLRRIRDKGGAPCSGNYDLDAVVAREHNENQNLADMHCLKWGYTRRVAF